MFKKIPATVEDNSCNNVSHQEHTALFGGTCKDCGILPVFTDDGIFVMRNKSRGTNQDILERKNN